MILTPEERKALLVLAALLAFGQLLAAWQRFREAQPDRDLSAWLERVAEAREAGAGTELAGDGQLDALAQPAIHASLDASGAGKATGGAFLDVAADAHPADSTKHRADGSTAEDRPREPAPRLRPAKNVPPGILTGGRLEIDRASQEELEALPGVGPALAARIIAEREARPFRRVEDLKRVKGIGPKTFERLLPWIQVRGAPAHPDSVRAAP